MANRVPQTTGELQVHLQEQIGFLERSAQSFDDSFHDEAKRLAVTMRLLLHDTGHSRSLLSQLGIKGQRFCDTAFPFDPHNLAAYAGLASVKIGSGPTRHAAPLDGDDPSGFRWIDFDEWWNAVIFRYDGGRELTRRDLILAVANQDGGAHVDPALNADYARLSRENALGRYTADASGTIPLHGAELVSVRQVAHEVLKTLKPGYARKPRAEGAVIVGGFSVKFTPNKPKSS